MTRCKYCSYIHTVPYDTEEKEKGIRKYKVSNGNYSSTEMELGINVDTHKGYMIAEGKVFNYEITSKKIKIKYCPWCGRKLSNG